MKNRLKEIRKNRRLSQVDLAKALNISRQAVSGFESGKYTPSLEVASRIAEILEVKIENIFVTKEKNTMQTLIERYTQWLPRGERFSDDAIAVISSAQEKAAVESESVEAKHLLYGLFSVPSNVTNSLRSNGLRFESLLRETDLLFETESSAKNKVKFFSPEARYVLESALQLARLKGSKVITPRHILVSIVQLVQLGNSELEPFFQNCDLEEILKF